MTNALRSAMLHGQTQRVRPLTAIVDRSAERPRQAWIMAALYAATGLVFLLFVPDPAYGYLCLGFAVLYVVIGIAVLRRARAGQQLRMDR